MIEILFDPQISNYHSDIINSRILAQIILFGISFKPILYFILLIPKKFLFKLKCYTSIHIDRFDQIDGNLLIHQQQKQTDQRRRYSLTLSIFHPKIHINLRRLTNPVISTNNCHLVNNDRNQIDLLNNTHV